MELFLGRVEFAQGDWARLLPIAESTGGAWRPILNARAEFPDDGLVFAPPLVGMGAAKPNSLWTFTREPNARPPVGKERSDRFIVVSAALATPIIDLSAGSIEHARQCLFEHGVDADPHASQTIVVLLPENLHCIVHLETGTHSPRRALASAQPVALMPAPPAWKTSGRVAGRMYVPSLTLPATPPARRVNWCGDVDFVERVLLRLRKFDNQFGGGAAALPGRETLQRVARALEQNELVGTSADDVELDLERLRSQWPRLQDRFAAAEGMRDFVMNSQLAQDLIEGAVAGARDQELKRLRPILENAMREELRAGMTEATHALEAVRQELASATAELEQHKRTLGRIIEEERSAAAQVADWKQQAKSALGSMQAALENVPENEAPLARDFLARMNGALMGSTLHLPSGTAPWRHVAVQPEFRIVGSSAYHAQLDSWAKAHAIEGLSIVDAFARAGELVLLTGPRSERALTAFVNCVIAGEVFATGIDPAVIGVEDLWVNPSSKASTAFARAWGKAEQHRDRAVVLCLRTIDAAPMHLWLPGLAAILRSPQRPRNLLVLATSLGIDSSSSEYPHHQQLLDWIVPLHVTSTVGSGLAALGAYSPTAPAATVLEWDDRPITAVAASAEFVRLAAELDPDAMIRAAKLATAAATRSEGAGRLLSSWTRLLAGTVEDLPPALALGLEDAKKLNYQH